MSGAEKTRKRNKTKKHFSVLAHCLGAKAVLQHLASLELSLGSAQGESLGSSQMFSERVSCLESAHFPPEPGTSVPI